MACAYLAPEAELANAAALVVIPDHDLVRGVLRGLASTHECQNIAAEEHLHNADASIVELSSELKAQRAMRVTEKESSEDT